MKKIEQYLATIDISFERNRACDNLQSQVLEQSDGGSGEDFAARVRGCRLGEVGAICPPADRK